MENKLAKMQSYKRNIILVTDLRIRPLKGMLLDILFIMLQVETRL